MCSYEGETEALLQPILGQFLIGNFQSFVGNDQG